MADYAQILSINYFGKEWTMLGNSYETLTWLDSSPKPTQEELDALWESTQDAKAKKVCKAQAKELLAASDWAALPDVGLKNLEEFVTYRGILRGLIISPIANPDFPVKPTPVWQ